MPVYFTGKASHSLLTILFAWCVILVCVYGVFYIFNCISPRKRMTVFPLLHILKTFSFVLIVPITLMGILLLGAQVLSISINYFVYRLGGNLKNFNRQLWRLLLFLLCCLGVYVVAAPAFSFGDYTRFALIIIWGSIRAMEAAQHKNILRIAGEIFKRRPS